MTTILIANLDNLTLVLAGSVMVALSEKDVPANPASFLIFLIGVFMFIIGALPTLIRVLGL